MRQVSIGRGVVYGTKDLRGTVSASRFVCMENKDRPPFLLLILAREGGFFMQKENRKHLVSLCTLSLLVAISIVCGKYLQIGVGEVLRFSFENLPIILAGILFGPIAGAAVGVIADLIGCFMVGYAINPLVMLGAAFVGFTSGFIWKVFVRFETLSYSFCLVLSVCAAHLIGSVGVKTPGLAAWYDFPLWELYLWRLLNYVIIALLESFFLCVLFRNKSFVTSILGLGEKK